MSISTLIWFGSVIRKESVLVQLFVSVTINVCIPALSAVGSLNPQSSLYGFKPPEIVNIAVNYNSIF